MVLSDSMALPTNSRRPKGEVGGASRVHRGGRVLGSVFQGYFLISENNNAFAKAPDDTPFIPSTRMRPQTSLTCTGNGQTSSSSIDRV